MKPKTEPIINFKPTPPPVKVESSLPFMEPKGPIKYEKITKYGWESEKNLVK